MEKALVKQLHYCSVEDYMQACSEAHLLLLLMITYWHVVFNQNLYVAKLLMDQVPRYRRRHTSPRTFVPSPATDMPLYETQAQI